MLGLVSVVPPATAQETEEAPESEFQAADDIVPPQEFRMVVDNKTPYPIDVIAYDDSDGSYSPYGELPAGGALDENVVAGLLWIFMVNNQALIGQYVTTGQPDQYVVLDEGTLSAAGYPPGPMDDSWRAFEEKDTEAPAAEAAQGAETEAAPDVTATPANHAD